MMALLVDIAEDRDDESARRVNCDTEVDIMFEYKLVALGVERAVDVRMRLERCGDDLQQDCCDRESAALSFGEGRDSCVALDRARSHRRSETASRAESRATRPPCCA